MITQKRYIGHDMEGQKVAPKKIHKGSVRLYVILFTVAALLALIILFVAGKGNETYTSPLTPIEIIKPQQRTILQTIKLFAHIEALDTIPVIPLVSGTITDYFIKAGDVVTKGDILAVIDKAPYEQQVFQARAAYESYESTFKRIEQLYNANAATLQDLETIRAQRDGASAQLELAELQLGYAEVKSPVQGTILSAPTAKGSIGHQEQPVAIVADLSNLVVKVNVSEKYFELFNNNRLDLYALVKKTDTSTQTQNTTRAIVDTISPYIKAQTKTFEVTFKLESNVDTFSPGMFTEVDIVFAEHKNVSSLPLSVLKIDKSFYTFTEDSEQFGENGITGKVTWNSTPITVSDNAFFLVPPELNDSYFVISGQSTVFDGQMVLATLYQDIR